jgi:hypothetical protein
MTVSQWGVFYNGVDNSAYSPLVNRRSGRPGDTTCFASFANFISRNSFRTLYWQFRETAKQVLLFPGYKKFRFTWKILSKSPLEEGWRSSELRRFPLNDDVILPSWTIILVIGVNVWATAVIWPTVNAEKRQQRLWGWCEPNFYIRGVYIMTTFVYLSDCSQLF